MSPAFEGWETDADGTNYFVFGYIWFWFPRQLGQVQLQALAVAIVFGPPFLYLAAMRLSGLMVRYSEAGHGQGASTSVKGRCIGFGTTC